MAWLLGVVLACCFATSGCHGRQDPTVDAGEALIAAQAVGRNELIHAHHPALAACDWRGGVWTTAFLEETDAPEDFKPLREDGATWICRADGHELKVTYSVEVKGQGYCGACYWGKVSAWLDGRKVIDDEDTGEAAAYEGADRSSPVLTRLEWWKGDLYACREFGLFLTAEWGRVCSRVARIGPSGSVTAISFLGRSGRLT